MLQLEDQTYVWLNYEEISNFIEIYVKLKMIKFVLKKTSIFLILAKINK